MANEVEKTAKIKQLFSSFLSNRDFITIPRGKEMPRHTDRNGRRDNEDKSVVDTGALPDARNRAQFYDRVETFSPLTWFAKPLELSPLVCARYGWKNTDTDILQCVNCNAVLCGQLPKAVDTHVFRESCNKLKTRLVEGHEKLCKWSSNPCPVSFLSVPFHDKEELMNNFWFRVASLQCTIFLEISYRSMETHGVNRTDLDRYVEAIQRTRPDHSNLQFSVAVCALCGWTYSESQLDVLQCNFCRRKIGLWNYKNPTASSSPEKIPTDHSIRHIIETDSHQSHISYEQSDKVDGKRKNIEFEFIQSRHDDSRGPSVGISLLGTQNDSSEAGKSNNTQPNGLHLEQTDSQNGIFKYHSDDGINGELIKKSDVGEQINMDSVKGGKRQNVEDVETVTEEDSDVPRSKRPRLEKQTFDPIAEHRYWCPWLQNGCMPDKVMCSQKQGTSPDSPLKSPPSDSQPFQSPPTDSSQSSGEPAWLITAKLLARVHEDDFSTHMKKSPQFEGLRHLRRVLRQCTSPSKQPAS